MSQAAAMSGDQQGHQPVRKRAFQAPQPTPAIPRAEDPTLNLERMYRRIWETSMIDMPFVNSALSVEVLGFRRWRGDWVGAVITPWFLNLFVLPGGGELWFDLPSGDRCKIAFPLGELEFIADDDASAEVPAYQYCPLFAPPTQFDSQEAARAAAEEALKVMFTPPLAMLELPVEPPPPADQPDVSRRTFFRRIGGR